MKRKLIKFLRRVFGTSEEVSSAPTTPQSPNVSKPILYTDRKGGKWYRYSDILAMSANRHLAIQMAQKMCDMNINKVRFEKLLATCIEACNKGEIVKVGAILTELETRCSLQYEREAMVHLICLFYLYEEEAEDGFDSELQLRKAKIISEDSELFSFFLHDYITQVKNLGVDLAANLEAYLVQANQILRTKNSL